MRWSRYLLPLLAIGGFLLGIFAVYLSLRQPRTPSIPFPPPTPRFAHFVAGQGMVEAASEDVAIGTPFSEIVEKVFVTAGQKVKQHTPLFQLNTSLLKTRYEEARAAFEVAEAEYQKQLDLPRRENIPPQRALVKQAEADLMDKMTQFELVEKVQNPNAVSRDEYNQRKYAAIESKYHLEEVEADLNLLLAGAWVRDLEIYRAQVKEAKTKIASIEKEIERSTICAPIDGMVLQVNVREGEFAQASELEDPLLIFGRVNPLHIRVDIDEEEVWRLIEGAPAEAFVRGNSSIHVPLRFVRLEPLLIPKRALTGENTERIDTRVLQLIYAFDRDDLPIYPGMLMDVYVESKPNR